MKKWQLADDLQVERRLAARAVTLAWLTLSADRGGGDGDGVGGRAARGGGRERALAHVLVERDGVDVAGLGDGGRAAAVAPSVALSPAAGVGDGGEQQAARSAVTSVAAAKSAASLPSTRSALRPVATPVALVVNGAPVALPVSMRPPSGADGGELERAAALEVGGADAGLVAGARAAAVDRAAAVAVLLVGLAGAVGRVVGDDLGLGAEARATGCWTGCACRAAGSGLRRSPSRPTGRRSRG